MRLISTKGGQLQIVRGSVAPNLGERLNQLQDKVSARATKSGFTQIVCFGSKRLRISLVNPTNMTQSLSCDSINHQKPNENIELYELSSEEYLELALTGSRSLSAYDAFATGNLSEWKLVFSEKTSQFFAFNSLTRLAFFYGLEASTARARSEVFRHLAHWASIDDGNFLTHAASLSNGEQSILITGKAGAGKSTFVQQGLELGYMFQGDNVVEIQNSEKGVFQSFGIYKTLKRRKSSPLEAPVSVHSEVDPEIQKEIHYLEDRVFECQPREIKKVVYINEDSQKPKTLMRSEFFFLLGPNSIGQFPLYERELLSRIRSFTESVPATQIPRMPLEATKQFLEEVFSHDGN